MLLLFGLIRVNDHLFGKELFILSFGLPCVSFMNVYQFVCVVLLFLVLRVGCGI